MAGSGTTPAGPILPGALFAAAMAAVCLVGPLYAATPRIVGPIDETNRVELKGQVHRAVREAQDLGPVDRAEPAERIMLLLHGSADQEAGLEQFLREVQTPKHPNYHRWLTPKTFGERYGVAPTDLAALVTWLQSKGFRIDEAPVGGRSLLISGTIGQVNDAFATRLRRYRWHGESHVANAQNPSVPAALAPVIGGFASLNDFRRQAQSIRSLTRLRPATPRNGGKPQRYIVDSPVAGPQYTSGSGHYLGPGDFATIYDLNSVYAVGTTGSGRSIAVLGRSDVVSTDLADFRSFFGLAASSPRIIVNGTDPGLVAGDELESDLDLEWSGAVAPGVSVIFVTSKSTTFTDGVDLSAQYAVSNNTADVITLSYGSCESTSDVSGGTTEFNQLWQQAAAQGISVFVSSGDAGSAGCDIPTSKTATQGLAVNALCSSPYSTCVGGTEFTADDAAPATYWSSTNAVGSQTSAQSYIGESVWNESGSDLFASGGGASIYYAKPAWQLATGVPSDGRRDVPDVALNAAAGHDPYIVFTSDGEPSGTAVLVGGTSAAAPSMAGIAALVAAQQGGRVGSINPVLYGLSGLQATGGVGVFHLITSGSNSVPGQSGFSANTADPTYNQASGLGSIDAARLLAQWSRYAGTSSGLSPTAVVVPATRFVGSASVNLPSTTSWTATVGGGAGGWLAVTPTSGTGSAPLTYAASANTASSARSGTITVDGQSLTVTQAAGGGSTAQLKESASTIVFGSDPVDTASAGQQVLISDTGTVSVTLTGVGLTGASPADFTWSGSCSVGLVLSPGASCYVTLAFAPESAGAHSASLQISDSVGGSVIVALSGTGTAGTPTGDGPLPIWTYLLLAAILLAHVVRRRHELL
jgi:subtilase family serine protease